jgi:hypothetical protein
MKRILVVSLALLAVGAAPASAAKCRKHKGEAVVARSSSAIITRSGTNQRNWVYRGCLFRHGRSYKLLSQDPDYPFSGIDFVGVKLHGPYAGLAYDAWEKGDTEAVLQVRDLRSGRSRGVVAGVSYDGGPRYTLERFALSEHGAVAWRGTSTDPTGITGPTQSVSVADSHGTREVDKGPQGSLAGPLFPDPRTVAWSNDGSRRTARAFYGLPRQD